MPASTDDLVARLDVVIELLSGLVAEAEAKNDKVVGSRRAARMLGIGLDHLAQLRREGRIRTVPHLSTARKIVFAVKEIDRVAHTGVTERHLERVS